MNVLGRAARVWMPDCMRKRLLDVLFARTAAALCQPPPPLRGLTAERTLQAFAEFTAQHAVDSPLVSRRLFAVTFGPGKWLGRAFGVASTRDVMDTAQLLYRVLGIDFAGDANGQITISHCFFSPVYRPTTCRVMSALDAGLLAGLSGGKHLEFSQRITDGYSCCRAELAT
jgi:hypothetical protein